MDELILRLLPDNQEPQELVLQQHKLADSILDVANNTTLYVFNDYKYCAQLICSNAKISNISFLLNGKEIRISYSQESGMINFYDESFGQRIFLECYGFVQITLIYNDENGNRLVKESEYIQVMVRKGKQNDSVRRMTEYIYSQNSQLLNSKYTLPKDASGLKDSAQKTIETYILLLEQISVVYDENYRYFKMNSRFKTISQEKVDYFEKLQFISKNTLQHIAQHPEELQRIQHTSGIRIGNYRYQPNKTLITSNEKSYDIYENRVVLGLLLFLLNEICRIQSELSEVVSKIPQKSMETEDYITSTYFIYAHTADVIKLKLDDLRKLKSKYTNLYYLYSKLFSIKNIAVCNTIPQFTPIFRSIPQYHHIFNCAVAWISKGAFTLKEEKFMLSFIKISALYEIYVLAKLINFFQNTGYILVSSEKIPYPPPGKHFKNTECNNCFIFKNDVSKVTIYYQPVIYNTDRFPQSGIGLYRNTSIPYPKLEKDVSGKHYTPDYLIKYEYTDQPSTKYLIVDAKFSTVKTIKNRQVAELVYKYLFSISSISNHDQIIGLCIFNGQSDVLKDSYTNIYDYELSNHIKPIAGIVTLTENSIDNKALHDALMKNSIGIYVTEPPQRSVPLPEDNEDESQQPSDQSETKEDHSKLKEKPSTMSKVASKRISSKKEIDISLLKLSELKFCKETANMLKTAGYVTVKDLVPNKAKDDLLNNKVLNRKSRREIEARLRQWNILLT